MFSSFLEQLSLQQLLQLSFEQLFEKQRAIFWEISSKLWKALTRPGLESGWNLTSFVVNIVLRNPGASWCDIFGRKLQVLRSPWELILTEPVPEVVEFRSADWAEKYFSAQSARSSSRVTLSLSYTKQFSSSIDLVAWPVQREGCRGEFQKKNIQRSRGNRKP